MIRDHAARKDLDAGSANGPLSARRHPAGKGPASPPKLRLRIRRAPPVEAMLHALYDPVLTEPIPAGLLRMLREAAR